MDLQQRATALFLECCEMAPEGRAAILEERCGGDRELLDEVQGMLAFDQRQPGFLAGKASDALRAEEEQLPGAIGPFRIRRKLGEGGMGAVYEAEQENPHRTVALKILQSHFLTPDALRRFEHESEFLARLQHPGIAQIFDSGRAETEHGPLPYFAMELVHGEPLIEYADRSGLSARERLELIARVADAVQHAHQNGVIHRDLKPQNILVDESGQPKVLDFGIARASDSDVQLTTLDTDVGQVLGTLAYMSPEQAAGDPSAIDTRADVYSLGVLLYELLAGGLPYDILRKGLPEAVRTIRDEEPRPLAAIQKTYRGDVDTIVRMALEKDKEHRYASAAALATDIRRFLRDEPIAARPPSRMYVLRKLVRRNKALALGVGVAALSIVVGLVVSIGLLAETKAALAESRWQGYRGHLFASAAELEDGNYAGALRELDAAREEHRGWEWDNASLALDSWLQSFEGHLKTVSAVGISRDETHVVTASWHEVRLWDAQSGASVAQLDVEGGMQTVTSVDVGPRGQTVVFYRSGSAYVWEPHEASPPRALSEPGMGNVGAVRLGPDANWVTVGWSGGRLLIWDLRSGEVRRLRGHERGHVRGLAVSPDGDTIVSSSELEHAPILWYVATGEKLPTTFRRAGAGIKCVAFSHDGQWIAAGCKDSSIQVWKVDTGELVKTLSCPGNTYVTSVAFNGDSSRIVSGQFDGTVRTWAVASGSNLWSHSGHSRKWATGVTVAAHPDGRRFLTSGYELTPRLWSFEAEGPSTIVEFIQNPELLPHDLRITPDGARIVAQAGETRIWSAENGQLLRSLPESLISRPDPSRPMGNAAVSPDGERMAIRPGRIVNLSTGEELVRLPVSAESLAFSPDGRWLVAGDSEEALLHVLDGSTGELLRRFEGGSGPPRRLCIDAEGTIFSASGSIIDLWDLEEGHRASLTGHEDTVLDLAVIPGGTLFASCSKDGSIRVWDSATLRCEREFPRQDGGVRSLSVSPDGVRIVSGSSLGRVRIWNLQRGDLVATLATSSETDRNFYSPTDAWVAFSPDGKRLLTSTQGSIRIWESERATARRWCEGR